VVVAGLGGVLVGDVGVPLIGEPLVVVSVGEVVDVGDVVSVGVVRVGVGVIRLGVCTLVRGTHVYSGSGTNPGGTTSDAGAWAGGGVGRYSWYSHHVRRNASSNPTVDVRKRPPKT
jgi:hypothetical protein